MNRIYSVVWSYAKKTYVVASEFASRKKIAVSATGLTMATLLSFAVSVSPLFAEELLAHDILQAENPALLVADVADAGSNNTANQEKAASGDQDAEDKAVDDKTIELRQNELALAALGIIAPTDESVLEAPSVMLNRDSLLRYAEGGGTATGADAIAIGTGSSASGIYSIAFGKDAKATNESSIAQGTGANAIGKNSIALGTSAQSGSSSGESSVAIGNEAKALSGSAVAIGKGAAAEKALAFALGSGAKASAANATALGANTKALGTGALALGFRAQSTAQQSVAIGENAQAMGEYSIAVGNGANVSGASSIVIGNGANTKEDSAIAIGAGAIGAGKNSLAQGNTAVTFGESAIAQGTGAQAIAESSIAQGTGANAFAAGSIALGKSAKTDAAATSAIAIGDNSSASGTNSSAIGKSASATGGSSIALGDGASATGENSVALGTGSQALADNSYALGGASVSGANTFVYGKQVSAVTFENGLLMGQGNSGAVSTAPIDRTDASILFGNNNRVGAQYDVQGSNDTAIIGIGHDNIIRGTGSLVFGRGNTFGALDDPTSKTGSETGGTLGPTNAMIIGNNSSVSEKSSGSLILGNNVDISATNAVGIGNDLSKILGGNSVTIGNNITETGESAVAIGDGAYAGERSIGLGNTAWAYGKDAIVMGTNASSVGNTGDRSIVIGANAKVNNVASAIALGDSSLVSTANSMALGSSSKATGTTSVALGNASSATGANSVALGAGSIASEANVVAVGSSSTNTRKIKWVTEGEISTTSKDAINGSQLYGTNKSIIDSLGGGAALNTNGTIKGPSYTVTNADGNEITVNNVGDALTNINGAVTNNTTNINNLTTTVNGGLTFAGDSGTPKNFKLGQTVSIVGGATANLTDGNIGVVVDSTGKLNIKLSKDLALGANGSVKFGNTELTETGLTIKNGPSVTTSGINAGNQKITNVTAGTADTDAVNVSQLKEVDQKVENNTTNINNIDKRVTKNEGDITNIKNDFNTIQGDVTNIQGDVTNITTGKAGLIQVKDGQLVVDNTIEGADKAIFNIKNADGSARKLTGVAPGEIDANSTDAINGSQLYETNQNVTNLGNQVTSLDGRVTQNTTNINKNAADIEKGLNFAGDHGDTENKQLGDTVSIIGGAALANLTDKNIGVVVDDEGKLNVKLAKNIDLGADGSVTTGNTVVNNDGLTINGGPSVTKDGINAGNKVISNVADGVANSDAVNKGQLDVIDNKVTQNTNNINSLDNRVTTNETNITNVTNKVNQGLTFTGDEGSKKRQLGDTINITGGVDSSKKLVDGNIGVTVDNDTGDISVKLAEKLDLSTDGSVTTGNTVVNNDGLTINGGPSVTQGGINAGNKVISNVADGVANSDAVNKGQLDVVDKKVADNTTSINNLDNRVTTNETNITNVTNKVNQGLTFTGDEGSKKRQLGDTINITGGVDSSKKLVDGNIGVTVDNDTGDISVKLAEKLDLGTDGSVTTGNTVVNNDGLTINGGPSVTQGGINAGNKVISNVADGVNANDAVNKSQLDNVSNKVADNTTNINNLTNGTAGLVILGSAPNEIVFNKNLVGGRDTFNISTVGDDGTTVTRKITGVTDGDISETSTDAINGSQLYAGNKNLSEALMGGKGTLNPDGTLSNLDFADAVGSDTPVTNVYDGLDSLNKRITSGKAGLVQLSDDGTQLVIDNTAAGNATEFNFANGVNDKGETVTRKLTGVSEGTISAESKDAINGSQLYGTNQSIVDSLGGGAKVNDDGTITGPSYDLGEVDGDGNNIIYNNVGDALTNIDGRVDENTTNITNVTNKVNEGLTFAGDDGSKKHQLGETVSIIGGADKDALTDKNIGVVVDNEGKLNVKLAKDINLGADGSVTTGNTVVNNDGLTINGGPSVTQGGINAGNKVISNVADGVADSDAVNKGQLDSVQTIANKGLTFAGDSGTPQNFKLGQTVSIVGGETDTTKLVDGKNIGVVVDDEGKLNVKLAKNIDLDADGSVTTGNTVVNNDGLTINGGPSVTKDGINAGNKVISNVADGVANSDAVNKGQLDVVDKKVADNTTSINNLDNRVTTNETNITNVTNKVNQGLTFTGDEGSKKRQLGDTINITGGADSSKKLVDGNIGVTVDNDTGDISVKLAEKLDLGTDGSVTTGNTVVNNEGLTINGGPSVTQGGINAGNKVISNVADGVADSDAVNKGQLDSVQTIANK
ncbi:ESPR-type extended signal peptide-containing protein, partial [Ignatzschineria ureiclastica]|uniref:ESPR-type extended signal peptide-containing protein n=1 Tax=Ignatzschineria ureiclastica TaxID=472582 RepID=UPI001672DDFD